ncbi:GntR family transcriptional regulator [Streptomyces lunaelactis]|uniref:GntR family transcriptional regulator n=1 Tax=Streptomyces lunaelactis TaxID=1535768 RepID=UPI001585CC58|nr:GntR family transcriptional regulator [Streptomyces lunaelactis]NUK72129.1 GntR family transcriptional regulator [Streptomyces lunaelactis]NUK80037.1 GntR family transcriptional regulator [Streptomyces lunaelactis]
MVRDLSGLPPYQRIAAQIIARIESGELQPGDHVPSVNQIMEAEGVSRATAARVPGVLRAEGYATATPGVGTIVAQPKKLTAGADRLAKLQIGTATIGDNERVEILDAVRQEAPQEVADALGLEAGAEVARRRRRYLDSAGVVTVSTTWVSAAIADQAPEFLEIAPLPKMTFGLIEERTGRRVVRRRDTVALREVPAEVAVPLETEAGTQTVVVINHYWDQNGEPTEYAVDYLGVGRELSSEYDLD